MNKNITIRIPFGAGYTLSDVMNKLTINGIEYHLKKQEQQNCYVFVLETEKKYHEMIINILDDLSTIDYCLVFSNKISFQLKDKIKHYDDFNCVNEKEVSFSANKNSLEEIMGNIITTSDETELIILTYR